MTNNDTFAKRLIQRRAEQGYSQEELSKISGIAAAQISRYEAGRNKPRANIIAKLAETLEVPFNWLAYGDESELISLQDEKGEHWRWLYLEPNLRAFMENKAKTAGISLEEELINALSSHYKIKIKSQPQ